MKSHEHSHYLKRGHLESPSGRSFIFDLQEVLPTDADKDASRCNWIDLLPVRAMKRDIC